MSLKNEAKKTIDNVSDAVDETVHRANAEGERAKRDAAGEALTPGEHARSIAEESKERVLAGVDRTKRNLRKGT